MNRSFSLCVPIKNGKKKTYAIIVELVSFANFGLRPLAFIKTGGINGRSRGGAREARAHHLIF